MRDEAHVSTVDDLETLFVRVEAPTQRVSAVTALSPAPRADGIGPEARTRAKRGRRVERDSKDGDVEPDRLVLQASSVVQMREGERAREDLVYLLTILGEPCLRRLLGGLLDVRSDAGCEDK